ncbi:MAG: YicC/YloC family endoribonuclease [Rhodospirillales bacterium]|nr:YicC/YloC family endoribonuclease [Rhodospirillales bacterium]
MTGARGIVSSMTGFAGARGELDGARWSWEIRSVNGRGLDVRCRLANRMEPLESAVRERVAKRLRRGNVTAVLTITRASPEGRYRINHDVLDTLAAAMPEVRRRFPEAGPPSVDALLAVRGVVEPVSEEDPEDWVSALQGAVMSSLEAGLEALVEMRAAEGGHLSSILETHLDRIGALCEEASCLAATQPDAIMARLRAQLEQLRDLVPALPEEKLAQEAALLAGRSDVREELDRLNGHTEAARTLLSDGGEVGRRLDFLCQEFNREANTLCSKASDLELTRVGLDLKAVVEQLREQVQNVE